MHHRFAILAAACSVSVAGLLPSSSLAQVRGPVAPAIQPALAQSDVPVKQVVLFSSGVGYFEHFGSVKGDASTELRFKTDQINDVLKSLLLQDMDGGKVGTVSYPGQSPLEHTLKSFQVDITDNPDMADLLNQLRGAKITISLGGATKISGTILGVERKSVAGADRAARAEVNVLNLKSGRQFRSIPLNGVQSMELEDPKLEKELDDALAALEQSRDQDKKPVTLHFNGLGERRVRIGYVVETPVWKTSYRLVLDDPEAHQAAGRDDVEKKKDAPKSQPAGHGAIAGVDRVSAKLQGWAIIDNQTDNDWDNVQLSLVSGRPLSFIQDLYHSLYIPRPIIQPDLNASLYPQTYSGGISREDADKMEKAGDGSGGNLFGSNGGAGGGDAGKEKVSPRMSASLFSDGDDNARRDPRRISQAPIDPTMSVVSAASASQVADLFQYTIGSVSLARQKSAMIPIVTDDVEAERLSIYNSAVLGDHPLLGARVKNTTKKYLLQGPITVLDHGSYAGDARIEDVPPGQQRFISYGIDQQVHVDSNDIKQQSTILSGRLVKGILRLTSKHVHEQTYLADNKSDLPRTLIIEHGRETDYSLLAPAQADETTPIHFRFRVKLSPHKVSSLTVVTTMTGVDAVETLPGTAEGLAVFMTNAALSQKVRDALTKLMAMKSDIAALNQKTGEFQTSLNTISSEQSRIRENMKSVSADTDYYKRLLKKLDDQETEIEKTQKAMAESAKAAVILVKQLNSYVANLNVE